MVTLYLSTTKGNGGIRHFPYQGFLGLTPVRIDGIVRTRLDEDQKPIPAFSLTIYVRSYEARQTRTGSLHSRILAEYSQTVWRKPDGQDYASLGDFEHPFKITLPKRVAGYSTANYQDYRTFWRVEAENVDDNCSRIIIPIVLARSFNRSIQQDALSSLAGIKKSFTMVNG
ncbi:hypothetical protein EW026_g3629 [Hermanssonia centrifuga]|uniref:Arrestin-like N-terminal domain-containing protein n=1 Tax=Hermanssonia centrifuga TaxID=98765 RepID=A0A4S4KKR8_9APHY|nr:hypothetical protein EW026_g3629 [Hermanssonia centrifuga]